MMAAGLSLGVFAAVGTATGAVALTPDRAAEAPSAVVTVAANQASSRNVIGYRDPAATRGHLPAPTGTGERKKQHGVLPARRTTASAPAQTQRGVIPVSRGGQSARIDSKYLPTTVSYSGNYAPGTIVIDTEEKYLYLVERGGKAKRYGVGVGRPGFQWAGTHRVTNKREWPGWTPPPQMRKRQPELPAFMPGGPENPLGARAMYLGSTLYRIHGSNAPWTIGHEVSSGCIRMRNEDVIELYEQVKVGTKVVVTR
ncbi:MAG: L,D-transpeptidase [Acuticoccus sp.]